MKISPIQNIYKINSSPIKQQRIQPTFCGDTFVRSQSIEDILNEGRHFKFDNYNKLSKKDKEKLAEKLNSIEPYELPTGVDAKRNYKIGIAFKEYLDKIYGKDNYIFECIGTSPAPIARLLEFSGVEVHYLPISNLQEAQNINEINDFHNNKMLKYEKFLSSQGIDEDMLNRTDKTYVFCDYTASGESLIMFEDMLRTMFNIPTDDYRIRFESLNDNLKNMKLRLDLKDINFGEIRDYIDHFLEASYSEDYAGVPHLHWKRADKIEKKIKEEVYNQSRYFNFYTMYQLEKEGLLKENPANKVSL